MRVFGMVLLIVCAEIAGAGTITGTIVMKGGRPGEVTAGYVGVTFSGQTVHSGAGMTLGDFKGSVSTTTFKPRITSVTWNPGQGCRFAHTALPPGKYLVYTRCDDRYMDWRVVTLTRTKPSATLTMGWSRTVQGDIKLIVTDRSVSYNVRVSPLDAAGRPPLPQADVPLHAGWDADVQRGSLLLNGMKPGVYQVELRRQQKSFGPDGSWSAIPQDAGKWSVTVIAGKRREYKLR